MIYGAASLNQSGHTIVVATHELEMIIAYADRLIIMHGGEIVRDGKPVDIVRDLESFGVRQPCGCHREVKAESWLN